ncbi:C-C motif chemokine 4-like [Erythrolamprus reginae]|uniref:C-C motif chemokine 4-like n=1 Tax=Erythrolamprus reginae TaxID=121349 RepID=UPI00396CD5C3
MRASAQTALLLLLVLMLSSSIRASDPPTSCCFSYTKRKMPRNLLVRFYETNSRCSQPAVVFITRKKIEICADPAEKWVQDYMDYLKVNRTAPIAVAN